MLVGHRERVTGVLTFAEELARALRREFDELWPERPAPDPTKPGEPGRGRADHGHARPGEMSPEAQLTYRVDKLFERAAKGRKFLADVTALNTAQALAAYRNYDANAIVSVAKGIEGVARELRAARPAPPANVFDTLPQGRITGFLRRLAGPAIVESKPTPSPTGDAIDDPVYLPAQVAVRRKEFDMAHDFGAGLLAYLENRMGVLAHAHALTGLPERRRDWDVVIDDFELIEETGDASPIQLQWLPMIIRQIYRDVPSMRASAIALSRWREANGLHDDAGLLAAALAMAPEDRAGRLLASFDLPRYRAALYPLSHLHITFKGLPHLQDLFPAPRPA